MTIGPREVMRSEIDGGLSGPANPIPIESLDCGCRLFPCPKLARFATRRLFVGLLCWVGIVQATAQAYLYVTSTTIARRFLFDPNLIEWVLTIAELTPFVLALLVAYWGDKVHRAAWTGALVLLQSAGFILLIIPNFTHSTRVIEEPENVTHMSIYAEDNPELCSSGLARIAMEEDEPCYTTLALLIGVQILTGVANIAYYALGISYLDDNTKKRHVAGLIGIVIAVKAMGLLLGHILAWACLKLDANDLQIVESYREQIGAWWLGWPILAVLLAIPGVFLSWLPRRLPSEVVEQAAASILDLATRTSLGSVEIVESRRAGDPGCFPSVLRLLCNKVLAFNVLASIFGTTALINFLAHENEFLESRYHVPKPTGMILAFNDPFYSRLTANMLKPILIGMIIIISGMVIARAKPRARSIAIYNVFVFVITATIIFSLAFAICEKPSIDGEGRGSIQLLKYCNMYCHCASDADFRPICDGKARKTFYSPCHAGCKRIERVDNVNIYEECDCIEEALGLGNTQAREGPCGSDSCAIGWLFFEVATLVAYSLAASSLVGSLLIVLRSVNVQDKALSIGYWMTFVSLVTYVPGKLVYKQLADMTCKHWGKSSICHLHDSDSLGDYICYLTAFLLILAAGFEIVLWFFCRKINLYGNPSLELSRGTELHDVRKNEATVSIDETDVRPTPHDENPDNAGGLVVVESSALDLREQVVEDESVQQQSGQLKYGPLGPGDRRTPGQFTNSQEFQAELMKMRNEDTDDELETSTDDEAAPGDRSKRKMLGSSPHVAYKPLELDSDVESDLSSIGPRSRRRIQSIISEDLSKDYEIDTISSPGKKRPFPNPDHYEDPAKRLASIITTSQRNGKSLEHLEVKTPDGFSRTSSFEFAKNRVSQSDRLMNNGGDFNEVGIPVMEPLIAASILRPSGQPKSEVSNQEAQVLVPRHQKASEKRLETIRSLLESVDERRRRNLEVEAVREQEEHQDVPPPVIGRPPSRGQTSSGFGSLADVGDRNEIFLTPPGLPTTKKDPESARTDSPEGGPRKGSPLSTAL